jgi:hypothetical protein
MEVINWVAAHWAEIMGAVAAVHAAAVAIVNLTPTPKDDEVVAQVYRWVEIAAGIVTPKAKK